MAPCVARTLSVSSRSSTRVRSSPSRRPSPPTARVGWRPTTTCDRLRSASPVEMTTGRISAGSFSISSTRRLATRATLTPPANCSTASPASNRSGGSGRPVADDAGHAVRGGARRKGFQNPGDAGVLQCSHCLRNTGRVLAGESTAHRDVDVGAGAEVNELSVERSDVGGVGRWHATRRGEDRKTAVELRDTGERLAIRPSNRAPDRQRILTWPGQEWRRIDDIVPTLEADRLAAEKSPDQLERFVEHLATYDGIHRFAECAEFRPSVVAESDAPDEAPVGELIQRSQLAAHHPWSPSRQWCHKCSKAYPPGDRGNRRHDHPGVCNRHPRSGEHVVPQEKPVPAGLLDMPRQRNHALWLCKFSKWRKEDPEPHRAITDRSPGTTRQSRRVVRTTRPPPRRCVRAIARERECENDAR